MYSLKRSATIIFLLFSLLMVTAVSHAQQENPPQPTNNQNIRFERLTTADGLSNNEVLSLLQDKNGFIWVGTFNGLNRYDGHSVTVYKNEVGNQNSLSSNIIRAIHEDEHGILWLATSNGGLNRFDPATNTFTHYLNDPENSNSLSGNSIISLYQDKNGFLWLGTHSNGVDRFDPVTETFTHFPELNEGSVESIIEDQEGNIWVAVFRGGLAKFNPETGIMTRFRHDPATSDGLRTDQLRWLHEDINGNIWLAMQDQGFGRLVGEDENDQSVDIIHYQDDQSINSSIFDGRITRVYEDSSGNIWMGGNKGIAQYDPQTSEINHYYHVSTDLNSLSHDVITAFIEDQNGILWIGTLGGGVSKFNPATERFTRYQHDPNDENSLGRGSIKAAYVDKSGILWLGSASSGLARVDPDSGQITHYQHDPEDSNSLSENRVWAILQDSTDTFWVGTWGGLDQFDPESGQFRNMHQSRILAAYEDSSNVMWFGTVDDGLLRYDRETGEFQIFSADPDNPNSLSDSAVSAILEDSTGAFWIGTWNGGLNRLDRDTGNVQVYRHDPSNTQSLSNERVEVLFEDQKGQLWIGTGNGLNKFERESETFTHYTEKDGLPENWILGILEESVTDNQNGFLWISTKMGLSRFDPETNTFQNYDESDGLQANPSDRGHIKSDSGEMIFGTSSGATSFHPNQLTDNAYIPPIEITNFKLLNQPVPIGEDLSLKQAIWETDDLILTYEDDIITFEFTALSYANPEENLLQYKMEGFDDDWSPPGTDHSTTYTNLDPGDYVFRVRGSNSDGVWNEEGTALRITITPPWWQTTWFRVLVLVLLVGLAYGAYRWRVRNIQARSRELEQEVADKTKDLQNKTRELQVEIIGHEETEQRLRKVRDELATLLEVSQDMMATLDLDSLLTIIINQLKQVVEFDAVSIHLVVDDVLKLQVFEYDGENTDIPPPNDMHSSEIPMFQEMFDNKQGFVIPDLQKESALIATIVDNSEPEFKGIPPMPRSFMAAPMVIRDSGMGMLAISSPSPDKYDQESLNLLQIFTSQIAIAIENAQLYEQAQVTAVAEERNRLARDLHDSVTQTLFSANVIANTTYRLWAKNPEDGRRNLEKLSLMTQGALAEMRTLLVELRPSAITKLSIDELLRNLTDATLSRSRVPVDLTIEGDCALEDDVKIALYRIAQEALNNITKYAEATEINVALTCDQNQVELSVRDNGRGFDPEAVPPGHLGLAIMRERAEKIGAVLLLTSKPEDGTEIVVTWQDKERHDHD